jgi:hypothetical protein
MLFILIFIRLFTDVIDLPTFFAFSTSLNMVRVSAIFVFLYYIPALIALRYLWKHPDEPEWKADRADDSAAG